jgi:tRNA threonylcarbamoyladenosine biosynthesis protein TsaB
VKLLGLDTATHTAGIAVIEADAAGAVAAGTGSSSALAATAIRVLGEARHDTSGRGADLLVAIDQLCRAAGIAPSALDAIAIGAGPGSFTGLRIGMATAKGIAFAAHRPLWAVSSLAALADDAARELARPRDSAESPTLAHPRDSAESPAPLASAICAVLDARRGEVFAGCFRAGIALGPERVFAPSELAGWAAQLVGATPDQLIESAAPLIHFAGDAIDAHRAVLAPLAARDRWLAARTPSGTAVARLAVAGARVDITVDGAPVYIRPSEAEVNYPDGVPGALRRR